MKTIVAALFVVSLLSSVAFGAEPGLVVAGRGVSLEEALAQPHAPNFRLLVLREELLRLRGSPAGEDVRMLLKNARREGAVVFVCERDLRAEQLERTDLVPGVVAVAASSDWVNGTPTQADRALRSLCS
jgi:predicted peroxiredoxin